MNTSMKNEATTVDAAELSGILAGDAGPVLVDTRLEEDFKRGHLPGARSNCVLEVAFAERMTDLAPDRTAAVYVYGADAGSFDRELAAEKLRRIGYERVLEFRGGMAAWKEAGFSLEGGDGGTPDAPRATDGVHEVDLEESRIGWRGRNLLNSHHGTIRLSAGSLTIENGRLAGGEFTIDMRSMRCADLDGDDLHDVLIGHLMDLDFFDVERHPEARVEITGATEIEGGTPGAPNLRVEGELTLRGKTAPLAFDTCAGVTAEGTLAAQATLAFDRTQWGARYGSGKWFRNLGGHLVNDLVEVELKVVSTKS